MRVRRVRRESFTVQAPRRRLPRLQTPSAPLLLIAGFASVSLLGAIGAPVGEEFAPGDVLILSGQDKDLRALAGQ